METTQASAGIGLVVRRCDCVGSQVNKESGQIAGMGWTNGGYAAANRTEGRQAGALAGGKRREHPQKTSGYHQKTSGHLQASQTDYFERPAPYPDPRPPWSSLRNGYYRNLTNKRNNG